MREQTKRWFLVASAVASAVAGLGVIAPAKASALVSTENFRFVAPTMLWDTNQPGQQLISGQSRVLPVDAPRTIAQFTIFGARSRSFVYVHDCFTGPDTSLPAAVFTDPGITEVNVAPIDTTPFRQTCITLVGDASVLVERIAVQDGSPGLNYVAQADPTLLTPSVTNGRVTVDVRDAQVPAEAQAVALFVGAVAADGQVVSMNLDSCTGGASTPVQRFVTPTGGFGDNLFIAPVDASGRVCLQIVGGQPEQVVVSRWGYLAPGVAPTAEGLPYSGWTVRKMPGFTPRSPRRLFDTRDRGAPMAEREVYRYRFTDLPPTATAVALNITVTDTTGPGYVSAFPCGGDVPTVSNVNFTAAGQTVPNFALVSLGRDDDICFYAGTSTHLLVDYSGFFAFDLGNRLVATNPMRIWDSRPDQGFGSDTPLAGGRVYRRQFSGSDATAWVFNVTVTQPQADGFVTVYPCDVQRPTVSNVNFLAGQTRANLVTVGVLASSELCFYTSATTHLVIDTVAYYNPLSNIGFLDRAPRRVFDTREGTDGPVERGFTYWWTIDDADIQALAWNVTVTQTTGDGFVTVWPCEEFNVQFPPTASNVNYRADQTVANFVIGPVSRDRRICFTTSRTTHLIADEAGIFTLPLPWEEYYDGEPPAATANGSRARIDRVAQHR